MEWMNDPVFIGTSFAILGTLVAILIAAVLLLRRALYDEATSLLELSKRVFESSREAVADVRGVLQLREKELSDRIRSVGSFSETTQREFSEFRQRLEAKELARGADDLITVRNIRDLREQNRILEFKLDALAASLGRTVTYADVPGGECIVSETGPDVETRTKRRGRKAKA